jgi:glycosyltransferase involved in cell wall biosynthesis
MPENENRFTLLHLGAVGIERNPVQLFKTIATLHKENIITPDSFTLRFIGNIENEVLNTIKQEMISDFVEVIDYLPHTRAIEETGRASAMLLLVTQSKKNIRILPGKTFEYLRTGKPVLALGPQGGEVDRILSEVQGGKLIEYEAREQIQSYLISLIDAWQNDSMNHARPELINKYERKNLTADLVRIFDDLI